MRYFGGVAAALLCAAFINAVGAAPAETREPGSYIAFNYGSLVVRPGCYLEALGKPKLVYEAHGPCGDAEDQDTWNKGVEAWKTAVGTWVDHCTAQGTTTMDKNCPPAPVQKNFANKAEYKPDLHTWAQYYENERSDYTAVDARFDNSLLDIRYNKVMLHKSALNFFDGYLYMINGGILGLNGSQLYNEDTQGWKMGSATVMVSAKLGLINSSVVMNQSLSAIKDSKVWLVDGSLYKQLGSTFILQNSKFLASGGTVEFYDAQIHVVRSTWNLTKTDVSLVRSNIYLWDSALVLQDTHLTLDNSRLLLSNVEIIGDGYVLSTADVDAGFGVTPGSKVDAMNIDFKVESETGKISLTPDAKVTAAGADDAGHGR